MENLQMALDLKILQISENRKQCSGCQHIYKYEQKASKIRLSLEKINAQTEEHLFLTDTYIQ